MSQVTAQEKTSILKLNGHYEISVRSMKIQPDAVFVEH